MHCIYLNYTGVVCNGAHFFNVVLRWFRRVDLLLLPFLFLLHIIYCTYMSHIKYLVALEVAS